MSKNLKNDLKLTSTNKKRKSMDETNVGSKKEATLTNTTSSKNKRGKNCSNKKLIFQKSDGNSYLTPGCSSSESEYLKSYAIRMIIEKENCAIVAHKEGQDTGNRNHVIINEFIEATTEDNEITSEVSAMSLSEKESSFDNDESKGNKQNDDESIPKMGLNAIIKSTNVSEEEKKLKVTVKNPCNKDKIPFEMKWYPFTSNGKFRLGFNNPEKSNMCFIGAPIQMLMFSKIGFLQYFLSIPNDEIFAEKDKIKTEMMNICKKMYCEDDMDKVDGKVEGFDLKSFKEILQKVNFGFNSDKQSDAHQFLTYFLDHMFETQNIDHFRVKIESIHKCNDCKNESKSNESFSLLTLTLLPCDNFRDRQRGRVKEKTLCVT